ncbi:MULTISPECIES: hypothetical protein [unclassified Chryseobacterium]|jgi:hypothetical protein|uniref:hypothetical protein n=1 Tax=unclassified Chryseobacterium TaxID=2593645 RepID=UPI002AFFBD02|nr:hypothetical protein [Chryseobacterium sp. MHB01]MEA1847534.1 hypothetical protein [Chryseobacterium sp. MHB01]
MKKLKFIIPIFVLWTEYVQACDACRLQQPKITQNFTHGTGPESNWDWVIVTIITIITLGTLFYSFKFLIKPNENSKKHIKNNILDF